MPVAPVLYPDRTARALSAALAALDAILAAEMLAAVKFNPHHDPHSGQFAAGGGIGGGPVAGTLPGQPPGPPDAVPDWTYQPARVRTLDTGDMAQVTVGRRLWKVEPNPDRVHSGDHRFILTETDHRGNSHEVTSGNNRGKLIGKAETRAVKYTDSEGSWSAGSGTHKVATGTVVATHEGENGGRVVRERDGGQERVWVRGGSEGPGHETLIEAVPAGFQYRLREWSRSGPLHPLNLEYDNLRDEGELFSHTRTSKYFATDVRRATRDAGIGPLPGTITAPPRKRSATESEGKSAGVKAAVEDDPPAVADSSNPHGLPAGDDIAQLLRRTFRDMAAHTRGWLAAQGTDRRPAELPDLSRYVRPLARRLEPLIARYGTDAAARTVAALWDGESVEVDHGTSARERARFAAESIVNTTMDQLRSALHGSQSTEPGTEGTKTTGISGPTTTEKTGESLLMASRKSLPAPLRTLWTALRSVFRRAITDRAPAIGRVEASEATHAGAVRAARSVQARFGVRLGKRWIVDGNPCEHCLENAAAGVIPVDDAFPSGHQHPTSHVNCQCSLEFLPMDSAES